MLRKNFWSGSLAYKDTLEKQYFIDSESKGDVITSKIDQLCCLTVRIIALVSGFYSSEHRIGLVPFTDIHVIYYINIRHNYYIKRWTPLEYTWWMFEE